MDMITVTLLAVITVATTLTFLMRITSFSRILKYHGIVDILFTLAMFGVFAGTLTGTLVAVLAGLLLTLTLSFARWIQRLTATLDR